MREGPRAGQRIQTVGVALLAAILSLLHLPALYASLQSPDSLDWSWAVDDFLAVRDHLAFGSAYVWTYGPLAIASVGGWAHRIV